MLYIYIVFIVLFRAAYLIFFLLECFMEHWIHGILMCSNYLKKPYALTYLRIYQYLQDGFMSFNYGYEEGSVPQITGCSSHLLYILVNEDSSATK